MVKQRRIMHDCLAEETSHRRFQIRLPGRATRYVLTGLILILFGFVLMLLHETSETARRVASGVIQNLLYAMTMSIATAVGLWFILAGVQSQLSSKRTAWIIVGFYLVVGIVASPFRGQGELVVSALLWPASLFAWLSCDVFGACFAD